MWHPLIRQGTDAFAISSAITGVCAHGHSSLAWERTAWGTVERVQGMCGVRCERGLGQGLGPGMPSRLAARPDGSEISIQLPSQKTPSEISKINLRPSFPVRLFAHEIRFRADTPTGHFRRGFRAAQKNAAK